MDDSCWGVGIQLVIDSVLPDSLHTDGSYCLPLLGEIYASYSACRTKNTFRTDICTLSVFIKVICYLSIMKRVESNVHRLLYPTLSI